MVSGHATAPRLAGPEQPTDAVLAAERQPVSAPQPGVRSSGRAQVCPGSPGIGSACRNPPTLIRISSLSVTHAPVVTVTGVLAARAAQTPLLGLLRVAGPHAERRPPAPGLVPGRPPGTTGPDGLPAALCPVVCLCMPDPRLGDVPASGWPPMTLLRTPASQMRPRQLTARTPCSHGTRNFPKIG